MSDEDKERQRERYRRGLAREVGPDERRRRRAASAQRRSEHTSAPRRGHWSEEDAEFVKIRRPTHTPMREARGAPTQALPVATVAAVHRGLVALDHGIDARIAGHLRIDPEFRLVVGDRVRFAEVSGTARIEALEPRRTVLSRHDPGNPHQPRILVANVDLVVVVAAAARPPLRPGLIDRLLLAAAAGGSAAAVCINKIDLSSPSERTALHALLGDYAALGHAVSCCSTTTGEGIEALRAQLDGRTSVLVGHSGVGKSSLLNVLDPGGARRTGEVRAHDGRGRHTTTASGLRRLDERTVVIDTPGVRAFGLDALQPEEIRAGFPEFAQDAAACRFSDCTHVDDPGCAVRAAVEGERVSAERYRSYLRILAAQRDESD
ncbi:MAG: ribosome small subunit-dependent GTPase A [Planctomycetes bacterium]|nr:ribosome small subunit-dependent GTPase A [Planctomycetota bacterium]MCB9872521.1 ribosome small subunit-dependent GTPase A [Planctomycetota bacterium]